jgi:uncharacterized protein (DUF58 family)
MGRLARLWLEALRASAASIGRMWVRIPVLSAVTAYGWTVLVAAAAVGLAGRRLGWSEMVLGGIFGLATVLLCAVFTVGRTSMRVAISPAKRRAVAGADVPIEIRATNIGKRRMLPVRLEVTVDGWPMSFALPSLPVAGQGHPEMFTLSGRPRGIVTVGPAVTVRGDPLGLLARRVRWADPVEVYVHPLTVRLTPFGAGLLRDLEGQTTNDVSMSDLAFHTLREYVPGDDRRYIHWRSSAKVGSASGSAKLLVRQFRDTRRTHVLVIVDGDSNAYADPEEFETAISAGASVAACAIDEDLETTVLIADQWRRRESRQRQSKHRVLDTCARAQLGRNSLAQLVSSAADLAPDATFALLATGSRPTFGLLRKVAGQLPSQVSTLAIRVDPHSRSLVAATGSPTLLTLRQLDDLPSLIRKGEVA